AADEQAGLTTTTSTTSTSSGESGLPMAQQHATTSEYEPADVSTVSAVDDQQDMTILRSPSNEDGDVNNKLEELMLLVQSLQQRIIHLESMNSSTPGKTLPSDSPSKQLSVPQTITTPPIHPTSTTSSSSTANPATTTTTTTTTSIQPYQESNPPPTPLSKLPSPPSQQQSTPLLTTALFKLLTLPWTVLRNQIYRQITFLYVRKLRKWGVRIVSVLLLRLRSRELLGFGGIVDMEGGLVDGVGRGVIWWSLVRGLETVLKLLQ
ncbi:hypothetical protein HDU76_006303, partial [Blyttiomyces sp. JEL0837]